jgi:hypothetical protein
MVLVDELKGRFLRSANRLLRPLDIEIARSSDLWRPTAQLGPQPRRDPAIANGIAPFLKVFQGDGTDLGDSFDFAVVMATTLRPTILRALTSIFRQQFDGRVQVLIGVDVPLGPQAALEEICRAVPERQCVLCLYPGYSSATRHGGQHADRNGGALRTVLSYLANSRFVAYLDDDNWWSSDHLASMRQALSGAEWAYSGRWFVHPDSGRPICKDLWESVGPGRGHFRHFGGWADPNCIAINKQVCEVVLPWWAIPMHNSNSWRDADRNVFRILSRKFIGRATGRYSAFYRIDEGDERYEERIRLIGAKRYAAAGELSVVRGPEEEGPQPSLP